jgi:predicted DCC family thiol-disulfide oxidoreductase YuxK
MIVNKYTNKRIVFYDGDCGFCSRSVQFILKKQKRPVYFMPLQSELAEKIIQSHGREIDMNTLFYLNETKLYERSSAVLKIANNFHFGYKSFAFIGSLIPKYFRDKVYDCIAKRRLSIAGKNCYLPTAEEKELFLK